MDTRDAVLCIGHQTVAAWSFLENGGGDGAVIEITVSQASSTLPNTPAPVNFKLIE